MDIVKQMLKLAPELEARHQKRMKEQKEDEDQWNSLVEIQEITHGLTTSTVCRLGAEILVPKMSSSSRNILPATVAWVRENLQCHVYVYERHTSRRDTFMFYALKPLPNAEEEQKE